MNEPKKEGETKPTAPRIPVDVWAVLLALSLTALVRLGWFPKIGW